MSQHKKIPVTNQSFMEAGGPQVFGDLEIITTVSHEQGEISSIGCKTVDWVEKASEGLAKRAQELDGVAVFKAEYDKTNYIAIGTVYGPKEG